MKKSLLLKGFNIGLSGAIPERSKWHGKPLDREILEFVRVFSGLVMKYGGRIVHGSHPAFTPILLKQAELHRAEEVKIPLLLVLSKLWEKEYPKYKIERIKTVSELIITNQVGEGSPANIETRNSSLSLMRKELISNINVFIAVGGKLHEDSEIIPGVQEEFDLAKEHSLPCFLLPALGGKTCEISKDASQREYRNNMNNEEFQKFKSIDNVSSYAGFLLDYLCRHQEFSNSTEKG